MDKELFDEILVEAEDYGENWVFEKMDGWDDEFKDFLLSLSYEKFEKYLGYTCEDSFLLPIDYDNIFEKLSVNLIDCDEDIFLSLSSEMFSVAVKSAYDYLHKLYEKN